MERWILCGRWGRLGLAKQERGHGVLEEWHRGENWEGVLRRLDECREKRAWRRKRDEEKIRGRLGTWFVPAAHVWSVPITRCLCAIGHVKPLCSVLSIVPARPEKWKSTDSASAVSAFIQLLFRVGSFIGYSVFSPQTVCLVHPQTNIKAL